MSANGRSRSRSRSAKRQPTPENAALPPAAELLKLATDIGLLKRTDRTGWVRRGVKNHESVAEQF